MPEKEVKGCLTCRWAEWKQTETGRLHSDRTGKCTYEIVMPALPSAFYYPGSRALVIPQPSGGWIERHSRNREYESCPTWEVKA